MWRLQRTLFEYAALASAPNRSLELRAVDAWLERMGVREAFCAVNPVVRALDALSSYSTYRGEEEVDGGTLRTSSSLLPCRKSRRCGQGAAAELTAITELTRAEPAARASTCGCTN